MIKKNNIKKRGKYFLKVKLANLSIFISTKYFPYTTELFFAFLLGTLLRGGNIIPLVLSL